MQRMSRSWASPINDADSRAFHRLLARRATKKWLCAYLRELLPKGAPKRCSQRHFRLLAPEGDLSGAAHETNSRNEQLGDGSLVAATASHLVLPKKLITVDQLKVQLLTEKSVFK